jgi:hypothetical protein
MEGHICSKGESFWAFKEEKQSKKTSYILIHYRIFLNLSTRVTTVNPMANATKQPENRNAGTPPKWMPPPL